jgi:hypothetical protein
MLGELIGEFKGKNTSRRVLPDGKIEASREGTGKILGIDAILMYTNVATMQDGLFVGETNAVIMIATGDALMMKSNSVAWPSGNGGTSRAASTNMTSPRNSLV